MSKEDLRIWAYLDGELSQEEQQLFQDELAVSAELKEAFQKASSMHEELSKKVQRSPAPGFTDRVMAALPARVSRVVWTGPILDHRIKYFLGFVGVALICALSLIFTDDTIFQPLQISYSISGFFAAIPPVISLGVIGVFSLLVLDFVLQRRLSR